MGSASVYSTNRTYKTFRKKIIALVLNTVDSFTLRVSHKRQYNNYLHGIDTVWGSKVI